MPIQTDADIAALLKDTRTIALIIASPKPQRDSNRILRYLLDAGYDVYPINPGQAGQEIAGRRAYADLKDVPVAVDLVDIFRRSEFVAPIVESAIKVGARAVWMQLGVIDEQAAIVAEKAGLKVVMDRCPAIEIPRLRDLSLL